MATRLNKFKMTDPASIAATLMANFATVRIPSCERLWTWPVDDPSPRLRARLLANALAGETLIVGCYREHVRCHLLEAGYRAFFDRIEGGGPDGWRLHFFCYDPAIVLLLHDIPVAQCGPGDPVSFDAEKFVMHHLRRLERRGLLGTQHQWWDSVDE
jgi:hypothetical protein